jgi:hypothetical protein
MADFMIIYVITIVAFIDLVIILSSTRTKRSRHNAATTLPKGSKTVKSPPGGKSFIKELFSNENSIFDERNKDGREGYSPWP